MKLIPLIITGGSVLLWNIIAELFFEVGENSTQRVVISGILAIVVYEISLFFYKKIKKNSNK